MTFSQQLERLIKNLNDDISKMPSIIVDAVSEDMTKSAQRNFDRDLDDVGADDPYVRVSRRVNGESAEVICTGNQVLFIEFGAGTMNAKKGYTLDKYSVSFSNGYQNAVITKVRSGREIPAYGFKAGGNEIAPRPNGIVELGEYGKGYGTQDHWVRPTKTGVLKNRERYVFDRNGVKREGVLWTDGTYPKRALWRARNSSLNKLLSGRLKLK